MLDPSTDKIIYEGKIMIRPDQGLVNNYQLKTVNKTNQSPSPPFNIIIIKTRLLCRVFML